MSCKKCIYAIFEKTPAGNIRTTVGGRCNYQVPMPLLPECVERHYTMRDGNPFKHRQAIWSGEGKDCKTFKDKNG